MNTQKGIRAVGACLALATLSTLPACASTDHKLERPSSGLGHDWISDDPVDPDIVNVRPLNAVFNKPAGQAAELGYTAATMIKNCVMVLRMEVIDGVLYYDGAIKPNDNTSKGQQLPGGRVPDFNKLIEKPPAYCA